MISICLTNYNRYEMLFEAFNPFLTDDRVSEIIIVDDCSDYDVFSKVHEAVTELKIKKVKLYRNPRNLGMSRNKAMSVKYAANEWVALLDSDNVFDKSYLSSLPDNLENNVIYCPQFARPTFDYRKFAGNIYASLEISKLVHDPMFYCLLNTCNYIVHRDSYLATYQYNEAHVASDTIWFNYNWLKRGGRFYIVPGMEYDHRVHDGSGFLNNMHYNMARAEEVKKLIMQL